MACDLISSFAINCREGSGGAMEFKVRPFDSSLAGVAETSGTVTFSGGSLSGWYTYACEKQTAAIVETMAANVQNGTIVYTQTLTYIFNKLQTAFRNELKTLAKKRLWVTVKDNNGTAWLFGFTRGVDLTGATSGSGTSYEERSGYTLTFVGMEPDPMVAVSNYDSLHT